MIYRGSLLLRVPDTANTNRRRARGIAVGRDVHARHTALQSLDGVVFVLFGNFVDVDSSNSACDIDFTLYRVSDNHNFIEQFGILAERHFHFVLRLEALRLIAYIRKGKNCALRYGDFELAVEIGGSGHTGGIGIHTYANKRFVVGSRYYLAVHCNVLRPAQQRREHNN